MTVLQFQEGLSDRQAAEAVRARIDWKYALSLELTDTGFDASVLSEFRSRLVVHGASERLLGELLAQFKARGLLTARGKQRTDSTHVLGAVRLLNRLELVAETLRAALEDMATVAPGVAAKEGSSHSGLSAMAVASRRVVYPKARRRVSSTPSRWEPMERVCWLRVQQADVPEVVRELASVQELGTVWQQQYEQQEGPGAPTQQGRLNAQRRAARFHRMIQRCATARNVTCTGSAIRSSM